MNSVRLGEIVAALGGDLRGDPAHEIARIAPLESAGGDAITFVAQARLRAALEASTAGAIVVPPSLVAAAPSGRHLVVTDDPYLYFARLTQWWAGRTRKLVAPTIHASASIDPSARLGARVAVGAFAVIEADAVIGDDARIGAHTVVGAACSIGAATRIGPGVAIVAGTSIGARGIVHPGVVLGADGFGFAPDNGRWEKIEQLGRVVIGDDVEIGANTCIDRGALGDTVIGDGVKIDNLVQVGHNVRIGAHTAIAGNVGIAGSTTIGAHCMLGGGAGVAGHVTIADHVVVGGATQVSRSIAKPGYYVGTFPFDDNASWEKNAAVLRNLHALRERVRALEKKSP